MISMEFDDWLESIIEIRNIMKLQLKDADSVMNELGYTKEEQEQLRLILKQEG